MTKSEPHAHIGVPVQTYCVVSQNGEHKLPIALLVSFLTNEELEVVPSAL